MAATCSVLSPDDLQCCICLDMFTDPVTIPCGHNFCKNCITQHWTVQNKCPMCRRAFNRRPELNVNVYISEDVRRLRQLTVQEISVYSKEQDTDVLCEVCTRTSVRAVKSCMVCLTSYCETHLEPHHRFPGLKRHQLMDPVKNLEDRLFLKRGRPLQVLCKLQ